MSTGVTGVDRSRSGSGTATAAEVPRDSGADVAKAYAPYLVIIVIFSIVNIPAVVDFLAQEPFTYSFAWPGLDITNPCRRPGRRPSSSSTGCPRPAR